MSRWPVTSQIAELRAVLADLDTQLMDLHADGGGELRDLTADEQARFDAMSRVRDAAELRLRRLGELERAYRRNPGAVEIPYANLGPTGYDVLAQSTAEILGMGAEATRDAALRAFDAIETRSENVPSSSADQMARWLRTKDLPGLDSVALSKRVLISESPAYRSAFAQLLTDPHPILTGEEAEAVRAMRRLDIEESRAMGEITPSAGGFGVPISLDPTIMVSSGASIAPLLDIAKVVPVNSNLWKGSARRHRCSPGTPRPRPSPTTARHWPSPPSPCT
jgi:hypothetical protein